MTYCLILGGTAGLGHEIYNQISPKQPCLVVGRREISPVSPRDIGFQADLASEQSTKKLIEQLKDFTSREQITDFFWVSGVLKRASPLEITPEQILSSVDVNFRNPLLIASSIWQHMNQIAGPCRFTIVSSTAGISDAPRDDEAVYASTKAAQVSYARSIGKHNKKTEKHVSLFCPGGMKTELWTNNVIESSLYETFMDPAKVATKILSDVASQTDAYRETIIPRGSV